MTGFDSRLLVPIRVDRRKQARKQARGVALAKKRRGREEAKQQLEALPLTLATTTPAGSKDIPADVLKGTTTTAVRFIHDASKLVPVLHACECRDRVCVCVCCRT